MLEKFVFDIAFAPAAQAESSSDAAADGSLWKFVSRFSEPHALMPEALMHSCHRRHMLLKCDVLMFLPLQQRQIRYYSSIMV